MPAQSWDQMEGPDGVPMEVSADGRWLHIDGYLFALTDVQVTPEGGLTETFQAVTPPPGGWQ